MSTSARRFVYGLFSVLGFLLVLPFALQARTWGRGFDRGSWLGGVDVTGTVRVAMLALVGLLVASVFLYAALSAGHPRAWVPDEADGVRCRRCDAEVPFGIRRCPRCDQQFVW